LCQTEFFFCSYTMPGILVKLRFCSFKFLVTTFKLKIPPAVVPSHRKFLATSLLTSPSLPFNSMPRPRNSWCWHSRLEFLEENQMEFMVCPLPRLGHFLRQGQWLWQWHSRKGTPNLLSSIIETYKSCQTARKGR